MNTTDRKAFTSLFRLAYTRCFGTELVKPLTEAESNHFSDDILESTGLVLGWKSLKNYSQYIINPQQRKQVNPSPYSLDILARYVWDAPVDKSAPPHKGHYPYWYQYRASQLPDDKNKPSGPSPSSKSRILTALAILAVLLVTVSILLFKSHPNHAVDIIENFDNVSMDYFTQNGWRLQSIDTTYWARHQEIPSHLTLFTLAGDNWQGPGRSPKISNLLVRETGHDCFVAELHFSDFIPQWNWQQAGLLLMQDTTYTGKCLRLSLGYNDYTGGVGKRQEIVVQAATWLGNGHVNPEEVGRQCIFDLVFIEEKLVRMNLHHSALRIEKRGDKVRLLYSFGAIENIAFKEMVNTEFNFKPRYIAIYAIKGYVPETPVMPVHIDKFSLIHLDCKE